jgi:hypothetical protein
MLESILLLSQNEQLYLPEQQSNTVDFDPKKTTAMLRFLIQQCFQS